LPKSRSIEIASGKNGLPSVTDAPAVAKPKFRHWYHGRVNRLDAAASFLKYRVGEYEAVRLYARAMLLGCPASARLFFEDRQSLED
jgi:hypothetical protein